MMHYRRCPFCHSGTARVIGIRIDPWAKCRNCRSVFRDITPDRFQQIHDEAFQDSTHIDATLAFVGEQPRHALWERLALPGRDVLEIGPGSGHLLAAAKQAGCAVQAVESSKVHRDYIRRTWDIESVYASLDEIPAGRVFDLVLAINVFEHVYDIVPFLHAVRDRLAPGGIFYLSTPNASSLEATALGTWWSMCKVHDHVSFPSPGGLALAARESGLRVGRIWTAGQPFEFPVSALTAARDRVQSRRGGGGGAMSAATGDIARQHECAGTPGINPRRKAALTRFYKVAARLDPTYQMIGTLGWAGTVKGMLIR
jgi:SAM-dependent methyltransferase